MSDDQRNLSQRARKPKQIFSPEQSKSTRNSLSQQPGDNNNHDLDDQQNQSATPEDESPQQQLCCICNQPYDGYSMMIDCERCKQYYHTSCIHLDVEINDDDLSNFEYFCNGCIEQLTEQVQNLEEKVDDLEYSVEKKTSLIKQHDSEIETLKEKHKIKLDNLQKEHLSKVKALEEKLTKCDDQRKQNQKDLTNSKSAGQALSEKLTKAETDLRGVQLNYSNSHRQLDVVRKTNSANASTIESLQTKITDLENQLKVQKEINTGLIRSQAEAGEQVEAVQVAINSTEDSTPLNTAPTSTSANPLQECQKKLKSKSKELETALANINHLEGIVANERAQNTSLTDQLDAANAELERLRRMNDLLLPEEDPLAVNGLSTHSFLQTQFNTSMTETEEAEQVVVNEGEAQRTQPPPAGNEGNIGSSDEICPAEWYNHHGYCDRSACHLNHNIDFTKLRSAGFCFHEFFNEGSCRHQAQCKYCHQIPVTARSDPNVKQHVQAKIQKGRDRKLNSRSPGATGSTNFDPAASTITATSTPMSPPAAPFLMNVVTQYDHMNTTVNSAPILSTLNDPTPSIVDAHNVNNNFVPPNAAHNVNSNYVPHNAAHNVNNNYVTNIANTIPTDAPNMHNNPTSVSPPLTTPISSPNNASPMSYLFLGQLIQSVVSMELQKRFPNPLPNSV